MISSEAPLLFAKAAQIFITEVVKIKKLNLNIYTIVDIARVDPYRRLKTANITA